MAWQWKEGARRALPCLALGSRVGASMRARSRTAACNVLRAAEVDIDAVAVRLHVAGRSKERLGVVAAKLREQGPVLGACRKVCLAVLGRLGKVARVQHGRVGQVCIVPPGQKPPCQLRCVHHGRHHVPAVRPRAPLRKDAIVSQATLLPAHARRGFRWDADSHVPRALEHVAKELVAALLCRTLRGQRSGHGWGRCGRPSGYGRDSCGRPSGHGRDSCGRPSGHGRDSCGRPSGHGSSGRRRGQCHGRRKRPGRATCGRCCCWRHRRHCRQIRPPARVVATRSPRASGDHRDGVRRATLSALRRRTLG